MGATAAFSAAAFGTGLGAIGQIDAGHKAEEAAMVNAGTIAETSELNAQLIEQGSELNAGVHDFNAAALEMQATDAVSRGRDQEDRFRTQIKGLIGSQRASFAAQGVDVGSGSAVDVQEDTARQGELDALTIRTNAAREAWGYTVESEGETLQAEDTRKLGKLQAENTRQVGLAAALNARLGGSFQATAANFGAASTIVGGAASLVSIAKQYGLIDSPAGGG